MLFNSLEFLFFFTFVTFIYYFIPSKIRCFWILCSSLFFYSNWNNTYTLILVGCILISYCSALLLDRYNSNKKVRKSILILSGVMLFGLLVYFKYANFIIHNLNRINHLCGYNEFNSMNIILPVGISFFIFQSYSYVFDVYNNKVLAERNIIHYALFISFFPQLVAGPIERSGSLLVQIKSLGAKKKIDFSKIYEGLILVLWGLFIKMVIADRVAIFVDNVFNEFYNYGLVELGLASIGFSLQIYCDFSGYSLIAIGCAKILSVELSDNFNSPYFSSSIKEFWRRWHISLSRWFRDYVYIPLGGNKRGERRKKVNVLITMGLSGLWHGASWTFVFWGFLHGLYQIVEDSVKNIVTKFNSFFGIKEDVFSYKLFRRICTFILVDFAWIFFRADSLKEALNFIKRMLMNRNWWVLFDNSIYDMGLSHVEVQVLIVASLILLFVDYAQYKTNKRIEVLLLEQNFLFRSLTLIFLFSCIWIFGVYGPGFDGKQFIYFQF